MVLEFFSVMVQNQDQLEAEESHRRDGWVPDPVLMPSGRPNVVDGVGAIYHLVRGTDDEIALYVIKASPELNLEYAKKKMEENSPVSVGEFDGVSGTVSLPHGTSPVLEEGRVARVYKVYEKAVIWLISGKAAGVVGGAS